jgi:arylsulfatase A-like enzyme
MLAHFAGGAQYTAASAAAPCTPASVQQILTGSLSYEGLRHRLAELLSGQGYATAAVVSQHLFRGPGGPNPRYARGFEHFDIQGADEVDQHRMTVRTASEVTDRGLAWLRGRDPDRPFLLWLHYFDPHDPYDPPPAYRIGAGGERGVASGDIRSILMSRPSAGGALWERDPGLTPQQVTGLVSRYDGEIRFVDDEVGRLLDLLAEAGLASRTITVLTSDHGERFGEDGRWGHCQTLHRREIEVPLLLRVGDDHPGPRGVVDTPVSTLDIVPTILELLDIPAPAAYPDGRSLLRPEPGRVLFAAWPPAWMAREGEHKLYVEKGEAPALCRIAPGHEEALLPPGAEPEVEARLKSAIAEGASRLRRAREQNRSLVPRLRALGYLE